MKVTDHYQLATTPQHYKHCRDLLKLDPWPGDEGRQLNFPTIMALREGKCIGVLSTANLKKTKAVVVNTIRVDPSIPNQAFIFLRLAEAYEVILRRAGCTFYWAYVYKEAKPLVRMLTRFFGGHESETDDHYWFKRSVA